MNLIPVNQEDGKVCIVNFDLVTHIDDIPSGNYIFNGLQWINSKEGFRAIYLQDGKTIFTKDSTIEILNKLDYQEPKRNSTSSNRPITTSGTST